LRRGIAADHELLLLLHLHLEPPGRPPLDVRRRRILGDEALEGFPFRLPVGREAVRRQPARREETFAALDQALERRAPHRQRLRRSSSAGGSPVAAFSTLPPSWKAISASRRRDTM